MHEISGMVFIFQQDSAVAHRACETISLLEWETPAFIPLHLWLPTVQIGIRLTTEVGEKCSSGSTRRMFFMLTKWSSTCHMYYLARGLEQKSVISDAINDWSRHTYNVIHTYIAICRARCVDSTEYMSNQRRWRQSLGGQLLASKVISF